MGGQRTRSAERETARARSGGRLESVPTLRQRADPPLSQAAILLSLQRTAGNRAVSALVQRLASWDAAGDVTENLHIAQRGARGEATLGYTPPTLNNQRLDEPSDAPGTLQPPVIDVSEGEDGTFAASVKSLPHNTGSFEMELPSRNTWTAPSTLQQAFSVAGKYGVETQLPETISGLGDQTTLAFRPDPDEDTFLANVRRHEQRHADDHATRFNTIVQRWDGRLLKAMNNRTEFAGTSEDLAKQNLSTAVGGTPDEVATRFFDACDKASSAFHEQDEGLGAEGTAAGVETTGWWPFKNPYGRVAIKIRHP
jgi:hypothetical protein